MCSFNCNVFKCICKSNDRYEAVATSNPDMKRVYILDKKTGAVNYCTIDTNPNIYQVMCYKSTTPFKYFTSFTFWIDLKDTSMGGCQRKIGKD